MLTQKLFPPKDPQVSFAGKTVIVTGGNTGLGLATVLKFVQKGASKVILTSRNAEKGAAAKSAIEAESGKTSVVEVWELEMGSYDSIRAFVKKTESLESLEIVVLNAGVMPTEYRKGDYGWEGAIQVNALSTTLLALLLLPKMKASKTAEWTPVIEVVSSGLHRAVKIPDELAGAPLEAYNQPERFARQAQYDTTKLFVQCAVIGLSKITQASASVEPRVIVTSVCPGACKSELAREVFPGAAGRIAYNIVAAGFFKTAEQGARTLVSGTVGGAKFNGGFWTDDALQP